MSESDKPADQNWENEFRDLCERYRQKLRRELSTLGAHLKGARNGDPGELEVARRLAHRLKGTSGSYELTESSACLQRIEDRIAELLESSADPAVLWAEIDAELERTVVAS